MRKDERSVRVRRDELRDARSEGVQIRFATMLDGFESAEGRVCAVWLRRTRPRRGGQTPTPTKEPPERLEVGHVVYALGYTVDPAPAAGVPATRSPRRLWIAGDAFAGPSTVATAMAHGRQVARSVLAALAAAS